MTINIISNILFFKFFIFDCYDELGEIISFLYIWINKIKISLMIINKINFFNDLQ